ncbi:hypothetical protein [Streptosporangium sp. KLBMP 9127]
MTMVPHPRHRLHTGPPQDHRSLGPRRPYGVEARRRRTDDH